MRISDLKEYNVVTAQRQAAQVQPEAATDQPSETGGFLSGLKNFGTGLAQSLGGLALGTGQLGRGIQSVASGGTDFGMGSNSVFDPSSEAGQTAEEILTPQTDAAKAGKVVGDIAQFAVPGAAASKATAGAGLATRAAGQGVTAGAIEAAQTGDIDAGTAYTALFGAATVPAGDAVKAASNHLSKSLPKWLVEPLIKQTKTAKEQGKDIVPFMVEKARVGTVPQLIQQSDESMTALNSKITAILQNSDETVNLYQVADDVARQINADGGASTADDIINVVQKQAFQSRGVLQNAVANQSDDLAVVNANSLRSQLDETLYAGKDYLRSVPTENKAILEAYTNALRSRVQGLESSTQPLFSEFSKEITLKKALLSAASSSNGRNAFGLMDILAGTGGFFGGGAPGALALMAGRRAFEAPVTKTALAATLKNTDKVYAALNAASPAVRGAFLELISSLNEEDTSDTQTQ